MATTYDQDIFWKTVQTYLVTEYPFILILQQQEHQQLEKTSHGSKFNKSSAGSSNRDSATDMDISSFTTSTTDYEIIVYSSILSDCLHVSAIKRTRMSTPSSLQRCCWRDSTNSVWSSSLESTMSTRKFGWPDQYCKFLLDQTHVR